METDSFFCNLFKQLPQTLFELLGLPAELARWYRFDAVELKKAMRIDGLLQPTKRGLPLYVVEVQHSRARPSSMRICSPRCSGFLDENRPGPGLGRRRHLRQPRAWSRSILTPYRMLLDSENVHRIYLDEYAMPADPPLGLGILQLASAPEAAVKDLVKSAGGEGQASNCR